MTERVKDFDKLLAEQVKQECESRAQQKSSNSAARIERHRENSSSEKKEEEASKARVRMKLSYQQAKMSSNRKRPAKEMALDLFQQVAQKHAKQDAERQAHHRAITEGLLKQQDESQREAAFQRRKQLEDRQVILQLVDIEEEGRTEDDPTPIASIFDTPMRPKSAAAVDADFMATPARLDFKSQLTLNPSMLKIETIDEEEEFTESIPQMRIVTAAFQDGNMELFESTVSAKMDGFAQVMDCSVSLQNGIIVPVNFFKTIAPSMMKTVASMAFRSAIPQGTLELSSEGLAPLQVGERVTKILSHGPFLFAKGVDKCYLWKYMQNTGTFIGPTAFKMDVEGAVALVDGAVIGFDVDLLSKKAPFSFDVDSGIQGKLAVGVQVKSKTKRLPKNRVGAEIVSYNGSVLILAHKTEGQQSLGYVFVEEDEKLQKVSSLHC